MGERGTLYLEEVEALEAMFLHESLSNSNENSSVLTSVATGPVHQVAKEMAAEMVAMVGHHPRSHGYVMGQRLQLAVGVVAAAVQIPI
jgi:hypothetical protein